MDLTNPPSRLFFSLIFLFYSTASFFLHPSAFFFSPLKAKYLFPFPRNSDPLFVPLPPPPFLAGHRLPTPFSGSFSIPRNLTPFFSHPQQKLFPNPPTGDRTLSVSFFPPTRRCFFFFRRLTLRLSPLPQLHSKNLPVFKRGPAFPTLPKPNCETSLSFSLLAGSPRLSGKARSFFFF